MWRTINERKYSANPHLDHLSNLKCHRYWHDHLQHLSAEMKGRHICQPEASWPYSCNNIGLEVHTCHSPHSYRLLLEVERASLHMLLSQFSHNFKKSTDPLQPEEALNSHSLLQGLFLIMYESCGSLQLTNTDYSVKSDTSKMTPPPPNYAKYITFHIGFHRLSPSQKVSWYSHVC